MVGSKGLKPLFYTQYIYSNKYLRQVMINHCRPFLLFRCTFPGDLHPAHRLPVNDAFPIRIGHASLSNDFSYEHTTPKDTDVKRYFKKSSGTTSSTTSQHL